MQDIFGDGDTAVAAPVTQRVKPAYRVTKLQGVVPRTIHVRDAKTGKVNRKVIEKPAGFMVHMMNGSSVRAWDVPHLVRLGVSNLVPMIDSTTGDTVGVRPL